MILRLLLMAGLDEWVAISKVPCYGCLIAISTTGDTGQTGYVTPWASLQCFEARRGGIPVGTLQVKWRFRLGFSLRRRFIGCDRRSTRASDHSSSAPDEFFFFSGHDAGCDRSLSGLSAWGLFPASGPIHRLLLEAATTNSSPPAHAGRRDPVGGRRLEPRAVLCCALGPAFACRKATVGGQSQGTWWSSNARPTFCVTQRRASWMR